MSALGRSIGLWKDGRFAWPFVVGVAHLAGALVLFDFAWRVLDISIEDLLTAAAAIFAVASIVLVLAIRAVSGKSSKP
jgi:hypothetical protein